MAMVHIMTREGIASNRPKELRTNCMGFDTGFYCAPLYKDSVHSVFQEATVNVRAPKARGGRVWTRVRTTEHSSGKGSGQSGIAQLN